MIEDVPFELSGKSVINGARESLDVPLFEEEDLFRRLDAYINAVLDDPQLRRERFVFEMIVGRGAGRLLDNNTVKKSLAPLGC